MNTLVFWSLAVIALFMAICVLAACIVSARQQRYDEEIRHEIQENDTYEKGE